MKKRKARGNDVQCSLAECEICRHLPEREMRDEMCEDPFSPATDRLLGTWEMRRCPLCGTRYSFTSESDTHHFMSHEVTIRRLK